MAKVQFKSNVPRHTRELSKSDFSSLGVENQNKVSFVAGEPTEVPDAVATALTTNLSDEFEIVADDAASTPVTPATDASDEGNTDAGAGGGTRDGAGARTALTR